MDNEQYERALECMKIIGHMFVGYTATPDQVLELESAWNKVQMMYLTEQKEPVDKKINDMSSDEILGLLRSMPVDPQAIASQFRHVFEKSTVNQKTALDILAEMDATQEEAEPILIAADGTHNIPPEAFVGLAESITDEIDNMILAEIAAMENKNSVCSLDDIASMCADCGSCNQKKDKSGGMFISSEDFNTMTEHMDLHGCISNTLTIDIRNEEETKYENAMKVVK